MTMLPSSSRRQMGEDLILPGADTHIECEAGTQKAEGGRIAPHGWSLVNSTADVWKRWVLILAHLL